MESNSCGLRIRLDPRLRQEFLSACKAQDRTAAQVLRDFMRDFVASHGDSLQTSFFDESDAGTVATKEWK
ncbi:hypothetical protein [Paraburkholderia phenazinium]|jgi:hypothetical protein|uniref:Ribbon-helix-helix protein RHH domain-containing protein n=1 Tax=Paraburkholderia phenazinium TaxID=60549 RepID=A0A1N6L786_9BURK|nr:hypothetical protein [Paraburkholderia phenazinium]SIO64547.1 hypothetical protein SAMN05444165_6322 [Paraburkholderia phenazinium]